MNDDETPHGLQPGPHLALVDSNREPILLPRPRALRPLDHCQGCRVVAAGWWRSAVESHEQGGAGVARELGADRPTVHRYGTREKLLPLGDVLAAPPEVAARVLRLGIERVEQAPLSCEGSLVGEALRVCAEGAALAARLETCRPEALSTGAREELAAWAERLALRLWRIAPRLREGSQSRNRDIDPTTGERP